MSEISWFSGLQNCLRVFLGFFWLCLPTQFSASLAGHGYLHVTVVRVGQHGSKDPGKTSGDLVHPRAGLHPRSGGASQAWAPSQVWGCTELPKAGILGILDTEEYFQKSSRLRNILNKFTHFLSHSEQNKSTIFVAVIFWIVLPASPVPYFLN